VKAVSAVRVAAALACILPAAVGHAQDTPAIDPIVDCRTAAAAAGFEAPVSLGVRLEAQDLIVDGFSRSEVGVARLICRLKPGEVVELRLYHAGSRDAAPDWTQADILPEPNPRAGGGGPVPGEPEAMSLAPAELSRAEAGSGQAADPAAGRPAPRAAPKPVAAPGRERAASPAQDAPAPRPAPGGIAAAVEDGTLVGPPAPEITAVPGTQSGVAPATTFRVGWGEGYAPDGADAATVTCYRRRGACYETNGRLDIGWTAREFPRDDATPE